LAAGAVVLLASGARPDGQAPDGRRAAKPSASLADRVGAILARPAFKHAMFGIEFLSLDANAPIYALNADKLFVPGSTTKLVTMGSALQLLGPDYRFHTRVYGTGEIDAGGTLHGDLVLVASGDPNLSGRIQPGDTLAFENVDHSYGGPDSHGLGGDPLRVVRELAGAVAAKGVKRIDGRVFVDVTLFPEGERDGGTGFVISPIVVNDNAIDIVVRPGPGDGSPGRLEVSPSTAYVRIVNHVVTRAPGSRARSVRVEDEPAAGDGTRTVIVDGEVPADAAPSMAAYRVAEPSRFAEIVLAEALHERGIVATARLYGSARGTGVDGTKIVPSTPVPHLIAEHVSPPYREEVKITLKVSQNLHASATPYILGATAGHERVAQAGFDAIRRFLESTGADVSGAAQSDGAGAAAHFTPDFMARYLAYMAKQPTAAIFHDALPVLGKDGTLWNIQVRSPAAGHVVAKTGTYAAADLLHDGLIVTGKGLAGYMTTASGQHLAFAIYVNNVPVHDGAEITPVVGEALGEIAAAAYGDTINW
jgi:PBP4 family serine-type D-alanyl-D-alanine carboxypeptidase